MKRFLKRLCTFPGGILFFATVFFLILIGGSFSHYCHWVNVLSLLYLNKEQLITYGIGLIAATVVYFQIVSLQEQLRVQTLIDYSNQWNSSTMIVKRKTSMNVLKFDDVGKDVNLDHLEQVLELLEDFSTLACNGVVDKRLVWDSSLGWYASRYFFYSCENKSIKAIRNKWSPEHEDSTYYENLESLYKGYLEYEAEQVNIKDKNLTKCEKKKRFEKAYRLTKDKFIEAENGLN